MKSKELIKTVVFFACLALGLLLLRQSVFTPIVARGHSMDPTSADGERVITLKNTEINRFDIITLPVPDEPDKNYIRRAIGLSGDIIAYKDDTLYINGKGVDEPYLDEFKGALTDGQPLTGDSSLKEKVPVDSYFVLGGNRRNSKGGRVIGFIHKKDILGEVKPVMRPLSRFGLIPEVSKQQKRQWIKEKDRNV